MKSRDGKSQRREEKKKEKVSEERRSRCAICGSGGSKSRLAKAAGAEPAGQTRDEKLHAVAARSTFASEKAKKHLTFGALFRSCDVEKVHAVVAQSTFRSQNVQSTPGSDHFWKLRCRKSARRCGVKHISKSKVQKPEGFGALLDVQMSFCVAGARDCARCQK